MATCKDCFHNDACGGFLPSDLDRDVFDYCEKGIADEIPDIEKRCTCFVNTADVVPKRDVERLQAQIEHLTAEKERLNNLIQDLMKG